MKRPSLGFTLIELLVVIGIIVLLLAISVPALQKARISARVAVNRASLNSIDTGLNQFKTDHGFFPRSSMREAGLSYGDDTIVNNDSILQSQDDDADNISGTADQGAHILFESMAGLDQQGFQKNHYYRLSDGGNNIEFGTPIAPDPVFNDQPKITRRWGPYVDTESTRFGPMIEAHEGSQNFEQDENTNPVFFSTVNVDQPRAILYYRANTSKKRHFRPGNNPGETIYEYNDNIGITEDQGAGNVYYHEELDPSSATPNSAGVFLNFIMDRRTALKPGFTKEQDDAYNTDPDNPRIRPYNPDTFILINPGVDGQYCTPDDILNFTKE